MISKTKAISIARDHTGVIYGQGTSWFFNHPLREGDLAGPSTTTQAGSYAAIREKRTAYTANLALYLLGQEDAQADTLTGRVQERVNAWLEKYGD